MIGDDKFTLVLENLSEEDAPMTIVKPEFMRRWADMQKMSNNANFMNNELQKSNFVINTNNPLIINLLNEEDKAKKENIFRQMFDLALLAQQMLQGEALAAFIQRSMDMMK